MHKITIQISGDKGTGKTTILRELATFLSSKGHQVTCYDDGLESNAIPNPPADFAPRAISIRAGESEPTTTMDAPKSELDKSAHPQLPAECRNPDPVFAKILKELRQSFDEARAALNAIPVPVEHTFHCNCGWNGTNDMINRTFSGDRPVFSCPKCKTPFQD